MTNNEMNLLSAFGCYMEFVARKQKEYTLLTDKYNQIETNKEAIKKNNAPKLVKKEKLLELKEKGILSKSELVELQYIEEKEKAIKLRELLVSQIETKQRRLLQEALDDYEKTVKKINNSCGSSIDYAETQYNMMITRTERTHNDKKRILIARGEMLEEEQKIQGIVKTGPEITADKQQSQLYKQMKDLRLAIEMSRQQVINSQTLTSYELSQMPPLPPLPEASFEIEDDITVMPSLPMPEISADEIESKRLRQESDQIIAKRHREEYEKKERDKEAYHNQRLLIEQQDDEKRKERFAKLSMEEQADQQAAESTAKMKEIIKNCENEEQMMSAAREAAKVPVKELNVIEFEGELMSLFAYNQMIKVREREIAREIAKDLPKAKIPPKSVVKREDKEVGPGVVLYSMPE